MSLSMYEEEFPKDAIALVTKLKYPIADTLNDYYEQKKYFSSNPTLNKLPSSVANKPIIKNPY